MLEFLSNTINRSNHIICLDYVSMNLSQSIARTKKIITYKRTHYKLMQDIPSAMISLPAS